MPIGTQGARRKFGEIHALLPLRDLFSCSKPCSCALSCGAFLAPPKRYGLHGVMQSVVVSGKYDRRRLSNDSCAPSPDGRGQAAHRRLGPGRSRSVGATDFSLRSGVGSFRGCGISSHGYGQPGLWWAAFLLGGGDYYVTNVESASVPATWKISDMAGGIVVMSQ